MFYATRARCRTSPRLPKGHRCACLRKVHSIHHDRPVVVGIRREDPLRIWERRCPLTPEAVRSLIQDEGVKVLVQPCERRIFSMDQFMEVGAVPHNSLEPAHIVLGIKEVPMKELLTSPVQSAVGSSSNLVPRTQIMFSHTIKGQSYNMPLLARFLNTANTPEGHLLPTLMDWELFTDKNGKRTCGFGWYAGVAGALEGLVSTAQMLLELGVATPFLATPRPHTAPISSLRNALHDMGRVIRDGGLPKSIGPFVICVTGSGQVSNGVLSLLNELPVKMITKDELPNLVMDPNTPLNQIYLLHATQDTYLKNEVTGLVAREDYYSNPANYESTFHETIAPYISLLINGVGWSPQYPRLMTNDQLVMALERVQQLRTQLKTRSDAEDEALSRDVDIMTGRCQSFADISCDVNGGLEFLPFASTLSEPHFSYKPPFFPSHFPTLKVTSVDILPTALPLDASDAFSNSCLPYIRALVRQYKGVKQDTEYESETQALERATIAKGGALVGKHEWLYEKLKAVGAEQGRGGLDNVAAKPHPPRKTVLLLGSGMVAKPAVDAICSREDVKLIIASDNAQNNEQLARTHANASTATFSIHQEEQVDSLIRCADVVISLLPVPLHPIVAELCVKHKKHLVTASYISPEMKGLHERAVNAGVLLLNEIGLDPGIDHCSALELLSSLRQQNKHVASFTSFCGGLPAPEDADVPLRYKFSWSPVGVLKAALNEAKFRVGGKETHVRPDDLLKRAMPNLPISDILKFEGIPNRDSVSYEDLYANSNGNSGELSTLFRGTLRYHGYSDLLYAFKLIGLLDLKKSIRISNWSELALSSLQLRLGASLKDESSFVSALADTVPSTHHDRLIEALHWFGALPSSAARSANIPAPPSSPTSPLELFAILLSQQLKLQPAERDLVVMHHEVCTSNNALGGKVLYDEVHSATLQVYGTPGETAMARCVGLPVAFAALKVLDEKPQRVGVCGPTEPAMYMHILQRLADSGIKMVTRTSSFKHSASVTRTILKAWD